MKLEWLNISINKICKLKENKKRCKSILIEIYELVIEATGSPLRYPK